MFEQYISSFHEIAKSLKFSDGGGHQLDEQKAVQLIFEKCHVVKKNGSRIYLVGNGGSSGIVSHASVDLLNTCKINAVPITDSSQITCFANDYGYERVFSTPLETMMNPEDMLFAVSSSGSSSNILNAVTTAVKKGSFVLTLSGFKSDNPLRKSGSVNIWIDSASYGMVEIGHSLILHYLTDNFLNNR